MASLTAAAPINGERRLLSPFHSAALKAPSPPPRTMRLRRVSRVRASSISDAPSPLLRTLRSAASGAVVLAALLSAKLSPSPARAEPSAPAPATEERVEAAGEVGVEAPAEAPKTDSEPAPLSQLLESNPDAVDAVRSALYKTLEDGDDAAALCLLRRLIGARPSEPEWKLLAARLLCELGDAAEARRLLEEVLAADPLSFEALFENAVLMDRCGEGAAALERLGRALDLARAERQERAARDVRLIIAQMQFLQRKVDEALTSYEELAREDPKDYRPYFCQGVIYSLLDRNTEAREKFSKYHELSPRKLEVDAYLQTPLSRMKLFGTTEDSNA